MTGCPRAGAAPVLVLPIERRLPHTVAMLSLALLLSACASVTPITLTAQEAATSFKGRSLDDPGLKSFATQPATGYAMWPPTQWDARALDVAALYFNPTLAAARAKAQAAAAAVATAGEIPNPTLMVAPQYAVNAMAGVPAWVVAASLVQIVETAGKRDFRVARARYLAEAARLDALDIGWQTIGAVNGALLDIAIAERRIAALDKQIAAEAALKDIAEKRLKAGLGSSLELAATQATLNKTILDRETSRTALTSARYQLAQAVGMPADALPLDRLSSEPPDNLVPPNFKKAARENAILNRADLLARLADYGASDAALQLEAARQYPDIEIGPGYEYDQGDRKWGMSLALALPLFNQNQGAIGEAVASRRQAADAFVAAQARVIGDIEGAVNAYDGAVRSFGVADDLARHRTAGLRARRKLFERGETDRLDLLSAEVEMAGAELARAEAEGNLDKARLALELASQRSLSGFDPTPLLMSEGS